MGNSCCGGSKTDTESPSKSEAIVEQAPNANGQSYPRKELSATQNKYKIKSEAPDQQQQYSSPQQTGFGQTKVLSPTQFNTTVDTVAREEVKPKPKPKDPEQCKDSAGRFNLEAIFDSVNPEILHIIPEGTFKEINGLAISPDNRYIIVTEEKELKFWDTFNQFCMKNVKVMEGEGQTCVSSKGNLVLTASGGKKGMQYSLKNAETGVSIADYQQSQGIDQPVKCMKIASDESLAIAITPNGKLVALSASSKKGYLVDKADNIQSGDISQDGKQVIVAGDESIMVFDAEKKGLKLSKATKYSELIKKESGSLMYASLQSVLYDSKESVYTGHTDGTIVCWSIGKQSEITYKYQLQAAHNYGVSGLLLSRDGAHLISHDKSDIKIWDIASKKCLKIFGTKRVIKNIALSVDDRYIVSSYQSGEIKIWNFGFYKDSPMFLSSSGHFLTNLSSENPDIFFSIYQIEETQDSLLEALASIVEHSSFTPQMKRDLLKDLRKKVIEKAQANKKLVQETSFEKFKQALEGQKSNQLGNSLIRVIAVLYDTEVLVYSQGKEQPNIETIQNPDCARPKIRGYLLKNSQNQHYDALIGRVDLQEFSQFLTSDQEAKRRLQFVAECVL